MNGCVVRIRTKFPLCDTIRFFILECIQSDNKSTSPRPKGVDTGTIFIINVNFTSARVRTVNNIILPLRNTIYCEYNGNKVFRSFQLSNTCQKSTISKRK